MCRHPWVLVYKRRFGPRAIILLLLILLLICLYDRYQDNYWRQHVLDVVIVEEHHEVLPYWHRASWAGKLRPEANTLLHIDAHSDMAPPSLAPDFPMFRNAESMTEVRAMMQRNDVFIVGSLISNVVNRVVWVWPSWDGDEHKTDYEHLRFDIGTTRVKMELEEPESLEFCLCYLDREGRDCFINNHTDPLGDYKVEEAKCRIRRKGVYEIVRDNVTQSRLSTPGWLPSPLVSAPSLILDIDLDFFGTESSAEVLHWESLLRWDQIQELTSMASELFCPIDVKAETACDQLMGSLIDTVVIDCKTSAGLVDLEKSGFDPGAQVIARKDGNCEMILKDVRSFVESYLKRILDTKIDLLCSGDKNILLERIETLTRLLISLNKTQLEMLQRVGFCIKASPKTFFFEHIPELHEFGVCVGFNTPNDTVVTYHYPSTTEINAKLKELERILSTRKFPTPGLVTIARSMRDGYTSKSHFSQIEAGVLDIIGKAFPEKEIRIVYDEDLMNGIEGRRWEERLKPN